MMARPGWTVGTKVVAGTVPPNARPTRLKAGTSRRSVMATSALTTRASEARGGERGPSFLPEEIGQLGLDALAFPQMALGHLGLRRDTAQVTFPMGRQQAGHEDEAAGFHDRHEG